MNARQLGPSGAPLRVLVVEDDPIVARDVKDTLEEMGFVTISPATRAREALALALVEKPDLLIMDVGLAGEMDGIATAEAIVHALSIPVVFFTGMESEAFRSRAESIPNAIYLPKPASPAQIKSAVESALALATGLGAALPAAD